MNEDTTTPTPTYARLACGHTVAVTGLTLGDHCACDECCARNGAVGLTRAVILVLTQAEVTAEIAALETENLKREVGVLTTELAAAHAEASTYEEAMQRANADRAKISDVLDKYRIGGNRKTCGDRAAALDAALATIPVKSNDFRGSHFDIKQSFAEGFDPGRVAVAFTERIAAVSNPPPPPRTHHHRKSCEEPTCDIDIEWEEPDECEPPDRCSRHCSRQIAPTVVVRASMNRGGGYPIEARLVVSRNAIDGCVTVNAEYLDHDGLGGERWSRAGEHPGLPGLAETILAELLARDAEDRGPEVVRANRGDAGDLLEVDLGDVLW